MLDELEPNKQNNVETPYRLYGAEPPRPHRTSSRGGTTTSSDTYLSHPVERNKQQTSTHQATSFKTHSILLFRAVFLQQQKRTTRRDSLGRKVIRSKKRERNQRTRKGRS